MKILALLLTLVLVMAVAVNGENLGELEEVMKPEAMKVLNNKVYITQGSKVLVYDLNGLKKVGEFGKEGNGPGESTPALNFRNSLDVSGNEILIVNVTKFLRYSGDYKYLDEVKRDAAIGRFVGVKYAGNGFVGSKVQIQNAQDLSTSIMLADKKFIANKELHRQKLGQQGRVVNPASATPGYVVVDNKIFVNKGEKKFLIDAYDLKGNHLYSIRKSEKEIKIDSAMRERIVREFKEDPDVALQIKGVGGWDAFKKIITLEFPEKFPTIKNIDSDGKALIVRTFRRDAKGADEFIVMDLKGKEIKRVHMDIPEAGAIEKIVGIGIKKYSFENGKVFWLHDNEDEETVELHSAKVY